MRVRRVAVAVVLSICTWLATTVPARAADDAIAEFGKFPCRFNGRVTTIDDAAKNVLLRISGRDHFFDDGGGKHSAVEWLLGEACATDATKDPRVILVENSELLKLAKVEARSEPGPLKDRYTLTELWPAYGDLNQAATQAAQQPPTEFSAAISRLRDELLTSMDVRLSYRTPAGVEDEQLRDAMELLRSLESAAVPLIVPPKDQGSGWANWGYAVFWNAAGGALKIPDHKRFAAVPLLGAIFDAHRADDHGAFAKAVAAYVAFLKDNAPGASSLSYMLPPGWMDLGAPTVNPTLFYGDTNTDGAPVANFRTSQPNHGCLTNLMYFPGRTATVEQIVNDWRINSGLAPLTGNELQRQLTPVSVGTLEGTAVDVTSNPKLSGSPSRQRAVIFRREDDALVFMATGSPEAVEAEKAACDALLASLRLGSPDESRKWFNLRLPETPNNITGFSISVVVVPRGADTWYFWLSGVGELSEAERKAYLQFIEQFPGNNFLKGGDPTSWTPPTGWRRTDERQVAVTFQFGEGDATRYLSALPLAGYTAASEAPLINDSRIMLNLPAWSAAEATAGVQTIKIGDADARAVELVAPAASK